MSRGKRRSRSSKRRRRRGEGRGRRRRGGRGTIGGPSSDIDTSFVFARFRLLRSHVDFPGLNIDSSPGILCPLFVNNDSDLFVLFARPVRSVFTRPESYRWRVRGKEEAEGAGKK